MIIALSIFSIIFACIVGVFLRLRTVRLAYIWLFFFAISFLIWIFLIFANPSSIQPFIIPGYFNPGQERIDIVFQLTDQSRLAGIGIFSILLAYLGTETARQNGNQSLYQWIEFLVHTAAVWVVLLSGNSWTVLISWTILDLVSLFSMLAYRHMDAGDFIPYYTMKFIGSMLLVFIFSRTYSFNAGGIFESQFENLNIFILMSVFLHAGFLYDWKIPNGNGKRRKNLILLRFFNYIASFFLLTMVPVFTTTPVYRLVFLAGSGLLTVYSALRWILDKTEFGQLNHLFVAIAGLTGFYFLVNHSTGLVNFLLGALLLGWVFLYTERNSQLKWFSVLILFMLSGLPFSLFHAPYSTLISNSQFLVLGFLLLSVSLLSAGFFLFTRRPDGHISSIQNLNQAMYTIGLLFPIIGAAFIVLFSKPSYSTMTLIFGSVQIFAVAALIYLLRSPAIYTTQKFDGIRNLPTFKNLKKQISNGITSLIAVLGEVLHFIAVLFEEQGGVMWAIVLLSLLLSVIASQGGLS